MREAGRAKPLLAAAAALAVIGVAAVGFGLTSRPGSLRPAANEFVNDRTGAEAHNSPSVAVDPRRSSTIAVANRLDAPQLGCALSVSTNDGATWAPIDRTPGLAAPNCFWPRVAYLPDGTLLVLYTDLVGVSLLPGGTWLQRYDGDRRPAGAPQKVAGDLAYHARMAVEGARVWLSWVQAGPATGDNQLGFAPGDNPVVVARSTDGGRTFTPPVHVSNGQDRIIQPTVVVGAGPVVTVGALDLADDVLDYQASHDGQTPPDARLRWRVVAWTSLDGGATFGPKATVAGALVVPQLIIADLGPTPGFAADPRDGRLYATWDAGRGSARDCFVAASDDGGRTWSGAVRVGPTANAQLLPAVSVAPDGRVDVVFYDRSRDPQDFQQDLVVASSFDGGRSFRWATVSDAPSDSRIGLGAQQGVPLQGDQLAALSRPDGALAFWADTSRGSPAANVQDLAVASVEITAHGGRRWAWAGVGGAVAAAGFALGLVGRADSGKFGPHELP